MFLSGKTSRALLLFLLIINIQAVKLQVVDRCIDVFARRLRARVLNGHVISSEQANSFEGCADLCSSNSKCYSVNYYNRKERCELNDKTTFMNPEDLVRELDGTYLDILRPYSDCSDLFCDRDEICKMKGVDRFQCKACNSALGMENKGIPDSRINASSFKSNRPIDKLWAGRLNNANESWVPEPEKSDHWLRIDLARKMIVTKIATQGRTAFHRWVTSYKISFSQDDHLWVFYKEHGVEKIFPGNTDKKTVVSHVLAFKIRARYVKFVPLTWKNGVAMRVELYGCEAV